MVFEKNVITEKFMEDRIIYASGQVDRQMSDEVVRQLLYMESDKPGEEIKLYINASPGGSVYDGLSIVDTMNIITAPVSTFCLGYCASMAAVIFSNGQKGKRFMLPNADIMIHEVSSGTEGKFRDMKATLKNVETLNKRMTEILARNCGKTPKEIEDDCSRDYWMTAEEAVAYGIADSIVKINKEEA